MSFIVVRWCKDNNLIKKAYESLRIFIFSHRFYENAAEFGIDINDCKWVELYHEYKKLKEKEHKMVYIVAFLSEKYEICERKVYKIIKSMERDCLVDAVG